jgi:hypothetical protein
MAILPSADGDDELCLRVSLECATATESNPVSFKELLESWRATASAPRTVRTFAVHLPLDEAAQLQALADMFPGRAPEQLITELLGAALKQVAAAMPYVAGKRVISTDEQGDPSYEDVGPTPRFLALTREHRARLEGAGGERAARRAARRPKRAARAAKRTPRKPGSRAAR